MRLSIAILTPKVISYNRIPDCILPHAILISKPTNNRGSQPLGAVTGECNFLISGLEAKTKCSVVAISTVQEMIRLNLSLRIGLLEENLHNFIPINSKPEFKPNFSALSSACSIYWTIWYPSSLMSKALMHKKKIFMQIFLKISFLRLNTLKITLFFSFCYPQ